MQTGVGKKINFKASAAIQGQLQQRGKDTTTERAATTTREGHNHGESSHHNEGRTESRREALLHSREALLRSKEARRLVGPGPP